MLVVFEGLDGSGKSTLVKAVAHLLQDRDIVVTKEPGSPLTKLGPMLRELVLHNDTLSPVERELLFMVDASQHQRIIEKNPEKLFLSDRGLWSHLAYQHGYLKTKQMDWTEYSTCRSIVDLVCARPDKIVYLRGDLDLMKQREKGKSKDVIESNGDAFYEAVITKYETLTKDPSWPNVLILNAKSMVDTNARAVVRFIYGER